MLVYLVLSSWLSPFSRLSFYHLQYDVSSLGRVPLFVLSVTVCSHLIKCKLGTRNATGQTLKTMFGYCCFPLANASFSWSLNHCSSILFLRGAVVGNSPFKWPIVKPYCLSPGRFSVLFWAPTSPPSNFPPSPSHTELCYSRHLPDNWNPSLQETWTAWKPIPPGPPTDSHRGEVRFYSTALLCKTNF